MPDNDPEKKIRKPELDGIRRVEAEGKSEDVSEKKEMPEKSAPSVKRTVPGKKPVSEDVDDSDYEDEEDMIVEGKKNPRKKSRTRPLLLPLLRKKPGRPPLQRKKRRKMQWADLWA